MQRPAQYSVKFRGKNIVTSYPPETTPYLVNNALDTYTERKLFNYSYTEFRDIFSYSRASTIKSDSRVKNGSNLFLLEEKDAVTKAFEAIKNISNTDTELSLGDANVFLASFKTIFGSLEKEINWTASDYFIVPLKGGGVITELFNSLDQDRVLKIDSKRVPLKSEDNGGHYGFGMHVPIQIHSQELQDIKDTDKFVDSMSGKKVTILELCVASGITTIGFLLDLYHRKIFPKELVVLSTAIAQQGYEISSEFAKELGIELKFVSAKMIYNLKDHFNFSYDPLTYDDGQLVLKSPYDAFQMIYNTRKKGRL